MKNFQMMIEEIDALFVIWKKLILKNRASPSKNIQKKNIMFGITFFI